MKLKLLLIALFVSAFSWGQFNINAVSTNYTQDFNTLTSGTWTDNSTLTGWYAKTSAGTGVTITTYGANTGSTITAGLYAFGIAGTNPLTDRALGYAATNAFTGASGTGKGYMGWRLKNNTGSAISSITVTWTGEQWRKDNNAASNALNLYYQTGTTVTDMAIGSWTAAPSTFTSPIIGATAATALDGNAPANRVASISVTITVTIAAGDEIMLRWDDLNDAGNDHQMAIDDVIVSAAAACSPPSNPIGIISGTSPACGSTTLTYTGADAATCYWQTSATGTSTTYPATATYSAATAGTNTYYVRNYSASCWSTSAVASSAITINNNPSIATNPSNTSVVDGNNASFTVVANNPGSYSWQVSTDGGGTYNTITNGGIYAGATAATLTITPAAFSMNGYMYQCIVAPASPCAGFAVSTVATLTVTSLYSNASDIVAVASSEPATISSTVNNTTISASTDGVAVWQFTVRDGGVGLNDADTQPTILTAFTLAQAAGNQVSTWSDAIFSIGLFDGSTYIANGTVTANQIQFTGLNVSIADGTSKTFTLRLSLKCPLGAGAVDGNDFGFSLSNANTTFSVLGSGKSAFAAAASANSMNVIDVTASLLVFTTQPVNTGQNAAMATVVVKATDACGNIDTGFTGAVSLSSTGTMNAVTSVNAVAGVASFAANIVHTVVGTGYTLTASATGVTSATSSTFNITAVTIFSEGDFAVVGVNSNINSGACVYGAYSAGDDEISFITFKDIQNGDVFYMTDNGYERVNAGQWADTEGVYQITRNGSTIPAGTVITFRLLNLSPFIEFNSPDSAWTFTKASGFGGNLVMNTNGDQIFFMQGGIWNNPAGAHDATYTPGTLLYAFNTGSSWTSFGASTQQSGLPIPLRCFNMMPTSATDYLEYTGVTTAASKYEWIVRLNDPTNWTNRIACSGYTRMHVGLTYTINADTYVNGVWTGAKSTDWFDCGNWQTLKVPLATTNVSVNPTYATKDAVIDVVANSATAALYSNQAVCKDLDVSSRKVQLEASTSNTLEVNGNLTLSGAGSIDMDDSNSATADGQINLHGNWTNTAGNAAFLEGNGTVKFNGTAAQVINNVTPEGTETYYNVIIDNNMDTAVSNDLIASGNLTVNAGKTLTIDSAGYARVNSKLSNNGSVYIDNNGQLVQVDDTDTNDGDYSSTKFQVKRTAQAKHTDYIYWSSPLSSFDVSGVPNGLRFLWDTAYNNINGTQGCWVPASGVMAKGKGYIARASNGAGVATAFPLTFSGSKPNNGAFTFGVYRGNYSGADYDADPVDANNVLTTHFDDNWNLVGNPYPSAIDAEKFLVLNQSVLEGSVWVWTHGLLPNFITSPFYATYQLNYSDVDYIKYNGLGSTDPDTFAGKIASGQGFMVNMKDVGSLFTTGATSALDVYSSSITFNNSLRSDSTTTPYAPYNNTDFYKMAPQMSSEVVGPAGTQVEKDRIWLDIVNTASGQSDRTLVGYTTNATMGKDWLYDCFFVPRSDVTLYSLIGADSYIIQGRALPFDSNDKVPLGVNIVSAGSHTIAIRKVDGLFTEDTPIYLEDKELGIIHDLKAAPYQFTATVGKNDNRFVLRYNNQALGGPSFETLNGSVVVTAQDGELNVYSSLEGLHTIQVFDILGRELLTASASDAMQYSASHITDSTQTILVKITLANGTVITRKVIL
jgi:hypothetical protein